MMVTFFVRVKPKVEIFLGGGAKNPYPPPLPPGVRGAEPPGEAGDRDRARPRAHAHARVRERKRQRGGRAQAARSVAQGL